MQIIPAILTTNNQDFVSQINLFSKYFKRIHIDIADGKLVPNTTTQITEMIELCKQDELVIDKKISFDFHLMVEDYFRALKEINEISHFLTIGTVLIDAKFTENMENLRQKYPNFSIGFYIDPEYSIELLANHYDPKMVNALQIMTVNPGFQGSAFLPKMLEKIKQLRDLNYIGEILLDGSMNDTTLPIVMEKEDKPDGICIGSFLTKAGEKLEERIKYLNHFVS